MRSDGLSLPEGKSDAASADELMKAVANRMGQDRKTKWVPIPEVSRLFQSESNCGWRGMKCRQTIAISAVEAPSAPGLQFPAGGAAAGWKHPAYRCQIIFVGRCPHRAVLSYRVWFR